MTAMMTATRMAWDLAGQPRRDSLPVSLLPGRCAVCGTMAEETVAASLTVGQASFTTRDHLADRAGDLTCYPCAWALAGRPPYALRTWTVACAPGRDLGPPNPKSAPAAPAAPGLLLTAKNDMRAVAMLLCDPPDGPWCAAVADTGHKHTLPWTPVNHGAGRWRIRFEAEDVTAAPARFRDILGRSAALRHAGLGRDEVAAMDPAPWKLSRGVLPLWREHAAVLLPYRGSAVLRLANLMITREHSDWYYAHFPAR